MQADGIVEKVYVRRGGGGLSPDGTSLDSIRPEGCPKIEERILPPDFRLKKKEAWFWRLKPPQGHVASSETASSSQGDAQPTPTHLNTDQTFVPERIEVTLEDETEKFVVDMKDWETMLRFKDVPDLSRRYEGEKLWWGARAEGWNPTRLRLERISERTQERRSMFLR